MFERRSERQNVPNDTIVSALATAPSVGLNYLEWNNLIANHFFNESMAGREVLLYINEKTISDIGKEKGQTIDDFLRCVKNGPFWANRSGLCQRALQTFEGWRSKSFEYPPYIAYLGLFVLAAGTEGDFAPIAYYPRLKKLIGEPPTTGQLPSFEKMDNLWNDLEKWSKEDRHEELGRFTARIRGGFVHAGIPLSQTLLSEEERKKLPVIFNEAELDPTDVPPANVMGRILIKYGVRWLEHRTLKLLNSGAEENSGLLNALLELVLGELDEWDGVAPEMPDSPAAPGRPSQTRAGLRICLEIDSVAERINRAALRFKTNNPFPEGGLNFCSTDRSGIWSCQEYINGYSTILKDRQINPPQVLNAVSLDWIKGILMEDKEKFWKARLKGANTRLFLPGNRYASGVPGWIESNSLERTGEFLVACAGNAIETVRSWGASYCVNFREFQSSGLPMGWTLFRGKNARDSCPEIDILTVSCLLRFRTQGGIRIAKGNTYFKFAPPFIILEGGCGTEKLLLNGNSLNQVESGAYWRIPEDSPVGIPLVIEASNGSGHLMIRHVIKLDDPQLSETIDNLPKRDNFGKLLCEDVTTPWAWGANVVGFNVNEFNDIPAILPTQLDRRIIFIGKHPGEIIDWPGMALPSKWQSVWALVKVHRDHWRIHFCGNLSDSDPIFTCEDPSILPTDRRYWRKVILRRARMDINPPFTVLKRLWNKYREVASRV